MEATSHAFKANAHDALGNKTLQQALGNMRAGFPAARLAAIKRLPEFEALRDQGKAIKDHTIAHLDYYLEAYEKAVQAAGGHVHWARSPKEACETILALWRTVDGHVHGARTPKEACETILAICRTVDAKLVTKGKSMVAEEIALNDYLEANGIQPVETDLGEYIIQLRHAPPSHIIAPAIHLMKEQVEDAFRAAHTSLDPDRPLAEAPQLCAEARTMLR